jgi:hypothetical protein
MSTIKKAPCVIKVKEREERETSRRILKKKMTKDFTKPYERQQTIDSRSLAKLKHDKYKKKTHPKYT